MFAPLVSSSATTSRFPPLAAQIKAVDPSKNIFCPVPHFCRPFSPFFLPCDRPSKGSGLSELLVAQDTVKMQGIFFLQLTTKGSFATWKQKTATLRLTLLTKWKICEQLTGQKIKKSFWVLYSADLLPWRHQWAEFWTDCGLNTRQDLGCFAVKSRNLVINVEEYYHGD